MPGSGLRLSRFLGLLLLCVSASLLAAPPMHKTSKYPLRIHVLASEVTAKSERMAPGDSAVCDAIDGILTTVSPNPGGPVSLSGVSGDPCSIHAEMVTGRLFDPDDEPVYAGEGRADLVSPPTTTQGFTFQYQDCSRVRVPVGFQSLPARWKKPGRKLEVLIPSDEIPINGRPLAPIKCNFNVTLHDFVYLLLRNGSIVQVSQEDYWKKPTLRVFLSGNAQTILPRPEQFTIPAHPPAKPTQTQPAALATQKSFQ